MFRPRTQARVYRVGPFDVSLRENAVSGAGSLECPFHSHPFGVEMPGPAVNGPDNERVHEEQQTEGEREVHSESPPRPKLASEVVLGDGRAEQVLRQAGRFEVGGAVHDGEEEDERDGELGPARRTPGSAAQRPADGEVALEGDGEDQQRAVHRTHLQQNQTRITAQHAQRVRKHFNGDVDG